MVEHQSNSIQVSLPTKVGLLEKYKSGFGVLQETFYVTWSLTYDIHLEAWMVLYVSEFLFINWNLTIINY